MNADSPRLTGNRRCAIIIDSCCDLPREVVDALDVMVLEFPYLMDDGEHHDDFWVSQSAQIFYNHMRAGETPSTAQVPQFVFHDLFARVLESGVPTVYLSFTSGLSGSFDTAERICRQLAALYPDGELHVVNTRLASIAEGMLVLEAVHQRDRGLTAGQLAAWVEEARFFVHGYFTLDDLEPLRRGGRIPAMGAYAGAKLDVKPVLTFDLEGNLVLNSVTRGRKKALRALDDLFAERSLEPERIPVIVASADSEHDADIVADRIEKRVPGVMTVRTMIGPVIGSHVGPGMVAVAFFGVDRRSSASLADRLANRLTRGSVPAQDDDAFDRLGLGASEEGGADAAR